MLPQEKNAWLSLSILCLVVATFSILVFSLGTQRATGAFGLMGLTGLIPVVTRSGRSSNISFDERDVLIQANAVRIAYGVFWVVFVAASMALWAIYQSRGALPAQILPLFPMVGWMVVTLVQSTVTLVQYARSR